MLGKVTNGLCQGAEILTDTNARLIYFQVVLIDMEGNPDGTCLAAESHVCSRFDSWAIASRY